MTDGLIGKKVGMTQVFEEGTGRVTPVTVLEVGPCIVLQVKTPDRDGYRAVQVGFDALEEEKTAVRKLGRPRSGHCRKANAPGLRVLREFQLREKEEISVGQAITVDKVFSVGGRVDVRGVSKGRGFAGVIKRHGFHGGDAGRGSMFHRAPGSIGASAWPSRVVKGTRLPGHMGNCVVNARNLTVAGVDALRNLLLVKGSVPGPEGGYVEVRLAYSAAPEPQRKKRAAQG